MPWQQTRPPSAGRNRRGPKSSLCRTNSSGSGGSRRGSSVQASITPVWRPARLSQLAQPQRVAQPLLKQRRRRRPPPPMGMPLAHYWMLRVARTTMRHDSKGGGSGSSIWGGVAARASQVQHGIECMLHDRAAWDSSPTGPSVAEPSGWNNDFGGAGADVRLATSDPLPQHIVERRARSYAWDIDLYYPPKLPPPIDPYAVRNQQQASVMGAWRQLRQVSRGQ